MSRLVRVGDVARELGISPARLRQLADNGVVPSERSPGGHRVFDPGAVRSALARRATFEVTSARWADPDWDRSLVLAGLQEDAVWRDVMADVLHDRLSPEGRSTASYAFTEMLNNAIDHSAAVDNVRHDQTVGASDVTVGTRVRWEMDPQTTRPIVEVFGAYTDEDHQFARTRVVVRLFGYGVRFVSRSEGKRLMRGLERFDDVTLDLVGVEEVGQGFVDEVFRVWPRQHANTVITPIGMTGPVEFMVRRGLPGAQPAGSEPQA